MDNQNTFAAGPTSVVTPSFASQDVSTSAQPTPAPRQEQTIQQMGTNPTSQPYALEDLESPSTATLNSPAVAAPANGVAASSAAQTSPSSPSSSPMPEPKSNLLKRILIGAAIVGVVVFLSAIAVVFISRNRQTPQDTAGEVIPDQQIDLSVGQAKGVFDLTIEGQENKLIVNGSVVSRGDVVLTAEDENNYGQISAQNLNGVYTYLLPNAAGTFCLDSNNCNYLQETDVTTTTVAGASGALQLGTGLAINGNTIVNTAPDTISNFTETAVNNFNGEVTIQGTANQVSVANNGGVITLSAPQDLAVGSSPTFNTITLSVAGTQNGNEICDISNNCGYAGGTNSFVQNGNSFGETAVLGTNDGFDLQFETNDITRLAIDADTGHISMGNISSFSDAGSCAQAFEGANCEATLNIEENVTDFSDDVVVGISNYMSLSPTSDNAAMIVGNSNMLSTGGTGGFYGDVYGTLSAVRHNTNDYLATGVGGYFEFSNNESGTVDEGVALQASANNYSGGSVSQLTGADIDVINWNGTVDTLTGALIRTLAGGTVADSIGLSVTAQARVNGDIATNIGIDVQTGNAESDGGPDGNIDDNYGIRIQTAENTYGTIGNNYGLYVQDQSDVASGDNYNIYSAGTGYNWFQGHSGVGLNAENAIADTAIYDNAVLTVSDTYDGSEMGVGSYSLIKFDGTSSGGAGIVGASNIAMVVSGNAATIGAVVGTQSVGTYGGDGQAGNVIGLQAAAYNTSDLGVVDRAIGILVSPSSSAGTTNQTYGILVDSQDAGAEAYGIRVDSATTQTLWIGGDGDFTTANAGIAFGESRDTNLYRSATNILHTDDSFTVGTNLGVNNTTAPNRLSVNTLTTTVSAAQAAVATGGDSNIGLIVQGTATQTANLQEWQTSDGTAALYVEADGDLVRAYTNGAAVLTNTNDANGLSVISDETGAANDAFSSMYAGGIYGQYGNVGVGSSFGGWSIYGNSGYSVLDLISAGSYQITMGSYGEGAGANNEITFMGPDGLGGTVAATLSSDGTKFNFNKNIVLGSVGTADTSTYLCRNASNEIATCSGTSTGTAFVQGGNSFGAIATLGTNDANALSFETNNVVRATLDTSGRFGIGTSTFGTNNRLLVNGYSTVDNLATAQINTTDASHKGLVIQGFSGQTADLFQIQNSSGDVKVRSGIYNNAYQFVVTPETTDVFSVRVNTGAGTGSNVVIQGTDGGTDRAAFYVAGAISGNTLEVGRTNNQNVKITSSASNKGLVVQGAASQTANLQEWQNSNGDVLASVGPTGKTSITPTTSTSTTAGDEIALNVSFTDTGAVSTGTDITRGLHVGVNRGGGTGTATLTSYAGSFATVGDLGGASNAAGVFSYAVGADTNIGVVGIGFQAGANTTALVTGLQGGVETYLGTVGGTVTNAYALSGSIAMSSGNSTYTTAAGLNITTATNGTGGVISNNYGIKIEAQTAGVADYGIRIDAADTQTVWISGNADNTTASAGIAFGASRDTNLYRSGADTLKTDDSLEIGTKAQVGASSVVGTFSQCGTPIGLTTCNSAFEQGLASTETSVVTYGANFVTGITPAGATNTADNRAVSATLGLYGNQSFSSTSGNYAVNASAVSATTSGTIALLGGVSGSAAQGGVGSTVTDAFGLQGSVSQAGGTLTTGYGLRILSASGTIGTNYGIHVQTQTAGTSDYGLRVDAADTQTLWVSGNADNTTAAAGIAFGASRDTNLYRSAAATLATNATSVSLTGASGTISTATTNAALTLQSNGTGTLTLDSGTTGAVNLGTGGSAKTITIGNSTGATAVAVNCGTGNCTFGSNAVAHTTTIGSLTGAATTTVQGGTGGVNVGTGGIANTIQIGNTTGAVAQTLNIGNNATASSTSTVVIGSSIGTSSVGIQAGTNGINIGTAGIANTIQIGNTSGAVAQTINIGTNATASSNSHVNVGSAIGLSATTIKSGTLGIAFTTAGTSACSISGSNQSLSCAGAGANSERFGASSTASGAGGTAVGSSANAASANTVAIGRNATAIGTTDLIAIGNSAVAGTIGSVTGAISIGGSSSATTDYGIALGYSAASTHTAAVALGAGATTTASNQLVVGSNTAPITAGYFGNGVTNASPQGFAMNATGGSGSNIAGASLTLAGGRGTGTGTGGAINFQTSAAGGSGSSLNSLSTVLSLAGGTGAATFQGTANDASALVVKNAAGSVNYFRVDTAESGGVDNVAQFNAASGNQCTVVAGTGWSCTSDATLKTNISSIQGISALDVISKLNPVTYNWLSDPNGRQQDGFLAQDVQQILPELVGKDSNGHLTLNKDGILPYIVAGVNAQQEQIDDLQEQINGLSAQANGVSTSPSSSLNLTSLNVSGATTLRTLTVTGSVTIEGNLAVEGSVSIDGNLSIDGHIIGNEDTRGIVTMPAGETEVEHDFAKPYQDGSKPIITLTATNTFAPSYRVESDEDGFTVFFQNASNTPVKLNYQVQQ